MATLAKRISDLERRTTQAETEYIPVYRQPDGTWLDVNDRPISEATISLLTARPGVVLIRVTDDDQIGLEAVDDDQDTH